MNQTWIPDVDQSSETLISGDTPKHPYIDIILVVGPLTRNVLFSFQGGQQLGGPNGLYKHLSIPEIVYQASLILTFPVLKNDRGLIF